MTGTASRWALTQPAGRVLEHRDAALYLWDGDPARGRLLGMQGLAQGIPAALAKLGVDPAQLLR